MLLSKFCDGTFTVGSTRDNQIVFEGGNAMGSVLALCNQKGGCGKTTSAVNIAAGIASLGKKTLLIDGDYQANATSYLGLKQKALKSGRLLSEGLLDSKKLEDCVLSTEVENLDLVAADMELERVTREKILEPGAASLLRCWLDCEKGRTYEVIVIDSRPALDLLFQNVMTASDYYALPLFPEPDSFDGLSIMFRELSRIQKHLNPTLFFLGAIVTKMKEKNNTHRKFVEKIQGFGERNGMPILGIIPESDAVARSSDLQKPLSVLAPHLPISKAYLTLVESLVKELKPRRGRTPKTPDFTKEQLSQLVNSEFEINDVEVSF